MSVKSFNNPSTFVAEELIEFVNNSGGALADGDVIVYDLAGMATRVAASTWDCPQNATTSTTAGDGKLLGIVRDATGLGVANLARGVAIRRGYHPTVKVALADTISAYVTMGHSGTAKTATDYTAAATLPGSMLGYALEDKTSTAVSTLKMFIDIK